MTRQIRGIEDSDLREGKEFKFTKSPSVKAASTFIAIKDDEILVTRRFSNLLDLPDKTLVIAHWHGQNRTEAFKSSIRQLKKLAEELNEKAV